MDIVSKRLKDRNKVLLVYSQRMVRGRTFEMIESLGVLTLAAQLNHNGFEARALTGITTDVMKIIKKEQEKLFAVCFYCDFDNRSAVEAMIKELKKKSDFFVLLGGPQTLHMTEKDKEIYQADAILKGEGEKILVEWLKAKKEGIIKEVAGEVFKGKKSEYVYLEDVSGFYYPSDEDKWEPKERPLLSVITARGCPYRCAFCFEGGNSKNLRMRSAEDVLQEIKMRLEKSRGPRYLFFADDTFTTNPKRLREIMAGLRELRKKYDFVWFCEAHPGFLVKHPELIGEMIESGMVRMQIGMESGVEKVLLAYGKQAKPDDIKTVIEICYKEGLAQLTGNYIIGGAFETTETLQRTGNTAVELLEMAPGMLDLSTTFIMPLPGTQVYKNPEAFGIMLEDRECLTSIEDFPVNHTETLSLQKICWERSRFITKVSSKMKEQFLKGEIPKVRIKEDFRLAMHYGITSAYFKFLYVKDKRWFQYYQQLIQFNGELKEWDELKEPDFKKIIAHCILNLEQVEIKNLSPEILEFLMISGSDSVEEMRGKLNWTEIKLKESLKKMNEEGLILFSEP